MYTIINFINDVEKAMYGFQIGEFKIHEEKYCCGGYMHGSTDLKKVTYEWQGYVIANIIVDVDRGTTIVHAKKKITDDLRIINPLFLKRCVRKCMRHEIEWIRGRNKIWDIFDDIHSPKPYAAILPKENKMLVLYRIVCRCFEDYESLETFLKKIASYVAPNWTVDIKVTDKTKRNEEDV
jgi:Fe-S oxidoreductase